MKTINFLKYSLLSLVIAFAFSACVDHIAEEENLPSKDVAFEYSIVDETYTIDYYVGAQIQFVNTSFLTGDPTWDFDFQRGDEIVPTKSQLEKKLTNEQILHCDTVVVKYKVAGQRNVTLVVDGKKCTYPLYISDIQPILTLQPIEGGLCEVQTTYVEFNTELPNPENLAAIYTWTFPEGTTDEEGNDVTTVVAENPGKVKFANVGSQTVRLNVSLGGRPLQEVKINVQVAYNEEVPTLYYAVKGGNIMALKLDEAPEGVKIQPFDMGVKSGQHAFNIIFADTLLYILDAGMQFNYVNDIDSVMGDGRITVMSKDGSKVETMISNVGGAAFNDPFYGYAEGNNLYVANRNTGFYQIKLSERNATFSTEKYPWYVQNDHLGYYNNGFVYGAMNACFGKVKGTWYWCKTYNGQGIYRFLDSDILQSARVDTDPKPAAGQLFDGVSVKSFAYDVKSDVLYFGAYGNSQDGLFRCSLSEAASLTSPDLMKDTYKCKTADRGVTLTPISEAGMGEGSSGEFIGICQMAIDENTGCVYFGLRSADASVPSGLYRYNPNLAGEGLNKIECVIPNVNIYGVAINKTPSKLF